MARRASWSNFLLPNSAKDFTLCILNEKCTDIIYHIMEEVNDTRPIDKRPRNIPDRPPANDPFAEQIIDGSKDHIINESEDNGRRQTVGGRRRRRSRITKKSKRRKRRKTNRRRNKNHTWTTKTK